MLRLIRRTRLLSWLGDSIGHAASSFGGLRLSFGRDPWEWQKTRSRTVGIVWTVLLVMLIGWASWRGFTFFAAELAWSDLGEATLLGLITLLRVVALIILASLVWVPIGVWLGLRPAWARRAQPVAQFLAAFPANLFFPVFVIVIVHFQLNRDVWLTPLMILGTQWYILFNVVAGAAAFPGDLREASANFRVSGFLWWRKVIIPGIFSYYVTGAITASGGCWNAAIVAEVVSWGDMKLVAHGLGAYIAEATARGDMARVVLGVAVMSGFVLTFNRLLWHPLYAYARRRFSLG
jgi:NitT/TauT family transport system permease protein